MGRRWKVWYSPGINGCDVCGSKKRGDLASPGFLSGELWCKSCLIVGRKMDASYSEIKLVERLGWLEDSRIAFRKRGLAIVR